MKIELKTFLRTKKKALEESKCEVILGPMEKRTQTNYDNLKFNLYELLTGQIARHPSFKIISGIKFKKDQNKFVQVSNSAPFYENLMNYSLVNAINEAVEGLKSQGEPKEKPSEHRGWSEIQHLAFLPEPRDLTRTAHGRISERFFAM